MSQKIKAPNQKGGNGFLWTIVAVLVIAAVVIAVIVGTGRGDKDLAAEVPQEAVSFEITADKGVALLAAKNVDKDAPVVDIFEDFSCPHCADLSIADTEDSKKALEDGKVKIRYHWLNFLDDGRDGSSTRGASVAYALAKTGNAKAFWNLHNYVMSNQVDVARTWGYEEFANAASAYDLPESVINDIRDGKVQDEGKKVAEGSAEELTKRIGQVSSPVVFADGKEVPIKGGPDGKPLSWVPDVVKN